VNLVVGRLRHTAPRAETEDAFHGIQRGLDEVVKVPDLAHPARLSQAKL
jgi:hypothetical protein